MGMSTLKDSHNENIKTQPFCHLERMLLPIESWTGVQPTITILAQFTRQLFDALLIWGKRKKQVF